MNKLLLCAYHLRKLRPQQGMIHVHLLTDEPERFPNSECRRMLAPWSNWVQIVPRESLQPIDPGALGKLTLRPGQIVIALFNDQTLLRACQASCEKSGTTCIVPALPRAGLDNDLLREVSFFDFEFGGKNEWDGAPTRYAAHCLRQLSSTHSKDLYPSWAFEPLLRARQWATAAESNGHRLWTGLPPALGRDPGTNFDYRRRSKSGYVCSCHGAPRARCLAKDTM